MKSYFLKLFAAILVISSPFLIFQKFAQAETESKPHVTLETPEVLSKAEAEKVYLELQEAMSLGYSLSEDPTVTSYMSWPRFNSAPYISTGHGNRYLNNYGNEIAKDYLSLKEGEKMPVGSILVKDSFTAAEGGKHFPGAVSIMEKLAKDINPETGDWRYSMYLPDGSLMGDTIGENPHEMDFCHACHEAKADVDFLFQIPQEYQ